jgi:hypothetical protein
MEEIWCDCQWPDRLSRLGVLSAVGARRIVVAGHRQPLHKAVMEDAMAGYLQEVTEVRQMLDSRYDDIKSGRVEPVEGEVFFESLRQREDELLKNRSPK